MRIRQLQRGSAFLSPPPVRLTWLRRALISSETLALASSLVSTLLSTLLTAARSPRALDYSVKGMCCMCVVSSVGRHRTDSRSLKYLYALQAWIIEGHNCVLQVCQGSLKFSPACPMYVYGLRTCDSSRWWSTASPPGLAVMALVTLHRQTVCVAILSRPQLHYCSLAGPYQAPQRCAGQPQLQ